MLIPRSLLALAILALLLAAPVSSGGFHLKGNGVAVADDTTPQPGLGWLPEPIPDSARVSFTRRSLMRTSPALDWTSRGGYDWMTPVRDQAECGACAAFAPIGAVEAQYRIAYDKPSWNLDLSEQHLFSCGGGSCVAGWYLSYALDYLQNYGAPDESCFPYQSGDGNDRSCSATCPNWQSRTYKISDWFWLSNDTSSIETALLSGPLVAGFHVYEDFYADYPDRNYNYSGGIYHYDGVSASVGYHAVVLVGYNNTGGYWKAKNSWGASWGENGYFRIGFEEAEINDYVAAVVAAPPDVVTATAYTAHHGSVMNWTYTTPADSFNLYWSLNSTLTPKTLWVNAPGTSRAYNATLPEETWGQTTYLQAVPVLGEVELPDSAGATEAQPATHRLESTETTVLASTTSEIKVRLDYQSLSLTPISDGVMIGEVLSNGTAPAPLATMITAPINLAQYNSEGYYIIDWTPGGGIAPGTYQVWFFLWNGLPSEGGTWEAYAVKIVVPITVT